MEKNSFESTYLDFPKIVDDSVELYDDLTEKWKEIYKNTLTEILDALAKDEHEKAQKALEDNVDKAKIFTEDYADRFAKFVSDSVAEAYIVGFNEGARVAEREYYEQIKKSVDEGWLTDVDGKLMYLVKGVEELKRKHFEEQMRGKNLHLMMMQNAGQDKEEEI